MFNPQLPLTLQTDFSRLNSIEYALLQDHGGGHFRLIQCGSRFLTATNTHYATIELELLAAVWTMHKCSFYLKELHHFEHMTDHRRLISILNNNTFDAVENPRLQRLKEKLSPFSSRQGGVRGRHFVLPMHFPATQSAITATTKTCSTTPLSGPQSLSKPSRHSPSL